MIADNSNIFQKGKKSLSYNYIKRNRVLRSEKSTVFLYSRV